jgi:branched-subunit amino acid ABC-type transport system permease component
LGGIGSPLGAMAGGLVIGISQNLLVYPVTPLNASYKPAISFLILILILAVRPQGLFGGGERSA